MERRVPLDTDVAILQGLTSGGSATSRMLSRLDIGKDDANFILILFIIILTMSLIINNVNMRHLTKQVKLLRQGSLAKLPIS